MTKSLNDYTDEQLFFALKKLEGIMRYAHTLSVEVPDPMWPSIFDELSDYEFSRLEVIKVLKSRENARFNLSQPTTPMSRSDSEQSAGALPLL